MPGVAVSDQDSVVVTGADGVYRLTSALRTGIVFASVPDGYRNTGAFWATVVDGATTVDFALQRAPARGGRLTFVHASDTHRPGVGGRMRACAPSSTRCAPTSSSSPATWCDALRVGEVEARGYYDLFQEQVAPVQVPLYTVPGNHEIFGIERDRSGVAADHPLYGRTMYRHYRGPDYYSFNAGGVHFVALNTVDIDDTRYYGHVDSLQLAWLERDLAVVPSGTSW
ncbi:MAG: hypothetical protein IPN47_22300 [Gemmatimonadetes bacterium]|nr:hypothetical protein [Gemmatimonadota bacterium]